MTFHKAEAIRKGGPWGQGFPEPLFHGEFELVSQRVVGEQHLKLVVRQGERLVDAIAFRQPPLPPLRRLQLAYRLSENAYGELPTLQLVVEHLLVLT